MCAHSATDTGITDSRLPRRTSGISANAGAGVLAGADQNNYRLRVVTPPAAIVMPVFTSSKIRTMPCFFVISRTASR